MSRKLQKHLEMRQVLTIDELRIGESNMLKCPFHHHSNEQAQMRWYEELNAVACMNPTCSRYQKVYSPIDMLQQFGDGNRRKATATAEEILIEELQEYRREAKHQAALLAELGRPLKGKKLPTDLLDFFKVLQSYLEEQEEQTIVFHQKRLYEELDIHVASIEYYLFKLEKLGYIERLSGDEYNGYEFEVFKVPEKLE